jgi:hypothetical protein
MFTGNAIRPKGELAKRGLVIELTTDRSDPENRPFKHPDALGWTEENRSRILRAFYTVLLGNPTLKLKRNAQMKTRFPVWQRLVGSAIEHASKVMADRTELGAHEPGDPARPVAIDFDELFKKNEADDEESGGLAEALDTIKRRWPTGATAADIAKFINTEKLQTQDAYGNLMYDQYGAAIYEDNIEGSNLLDFFYPNRPPKFRLTAKAFTRKLKDFCNYPVTAGNRTPKYALNSHTQIITFWVEG